MKKTVRIINILTNILIGAFLIALLSPIFYSATAQEGTIPKTSSDTRIYIIKEGDTLWKISEEVYEDPAKWPIIWEMNPQIKDPNRIKPGDELYLEGRAPTEVTEEIVEESMIRKIPEETQITPPFIPTDVFPEIEKTEEFEMEPSDVYFIPRIILSGFLSQEELDDSGYIDHDREGRKMITDDNIVFIKLPDDEMVGLKVGDLFSIFRVVNMVKHPVTGGNVGYAIKVVGELEVTALGRKTATAVISNANDVIEIKDRIRPFEPTVKTINVKKGKNPVVGYIVYSVVVKTDSLRNPMLSENDIVYIDRGYADGVRVGNVFDILQLNEEYNVGSLTAEEYQKMLEEGSVDEGLVDRGIIYPPDVVGRLVVLNAGEYTSTAVISSSNEVVRLGDMVRLQIQ